MGLLEGGVHGAACALAGISSEGCVDATAFTLANAFVIRHTQ